MNDCPNDAELAALVDGEVTESRGRWLRSHGQTCGSCSRSIAELEALARDVRTPLAGALGPSSPEAFADGVLARLDARRREPRLRSRAVVMLSAAAVLLLAVGVAWHRPSATETWTARGGPVPASSDATHLVLLRFGRVSGAAFEGLDEGATIGTHDVFAAEVGHTERGHLWLLAFLIDADGERHWIYPSYEVGAPPPTAEPLPVTPAPRLLSTMTRLDGIAIGPARLVGIVLPEPERVDYVEYAPAAELTRDRLALHYGHALVTETHVTVGDVR